MSDHSNEIWIVQATKQGFYDQILREPGEVFALINKPDGSMPVRMKRTYKKATKIVDGVPIEYSTHEYTESVYLSAEGEPMHADFSPHSEEWEGTGKEFAGETFREGWMRRVPGDTPVGIYPADQVFGEERRAPVQRLSGKPGPVNAPRATPSRGTTERPRRAG